MKRGHMLTLTVTAAYNLIETKGYLNHVVLQEAYDGWLKRGYPVIKTPP
ncbi:MAG: hypothetical protein ACREJE_13735 [Candidatus Rokuibacteriota bacterium]